MFHMRIPGALTAFVGSVAVACMAGCSRSDLDGEIPEKDLPAVEKPVGVAYLRLRMNLSGDGIPAGTRAEGAEGSEGTEGTVADSLPGSSCENAVNKLDLLVFDAESDLLHQIVSVEGAQLVKDGANDGVYKTNAVPVYAGKKQKLHIYVAANLPDNMRERLSPGLSSSCAFVWTRNDYWSLMNEILPGSDGKQKKLQSSGIPMTGQLATKDGGSVDIEFTEANMSESTPLDVTAELSRMVAKVHVVAEAKEYETTKGPVVYVNAKDVNAKGAAAETPADPAAPAEDYSNWIGWIRLANVRYMLNGVNKSTYFFPQPTGSTGEYPLLQDCNMNLESYVAGGEFDPAMRDRDYCFLQRSELHDKNVNAPDLLAEVEAYDAERLKGKTGHYVEGMYCLENYFNRPQNTEVFDRYEGKAGSGIIPGENADVIPMVTHVYVAAKLTPRYIVVMQDYKERMDKGLVNDFNTLSDEAFSAKYGVEKGVDFTKEDVDRWTALKTWDSGEGKNYFTGEDALYRNAFRIVKTDTEQQAADIIKWSLIANGLWNGNTTGIEDGKCPPDTFYVYDTNFDSVHILDTQWNQRYLYLTAGAVAAATDSNMRIKIYSVPHLGGWGYYYTYINQTGETYLDKENKPVPGRAPYTASQVTRNTYYILTINNFGGPGGTITSPEFIKVNTEPIGWYYGGKGDINLY